MKPVSLHKSQRFVIEQIMFSPSSAKYNIQQMMCLYNMYMVTRLYLWHVHQVEAVREECNKNITVMAEEIKMLETVSTIPYNIIM